MIKKFLTLVLCAAFNKDYAQFGSRTNSYLSLSFLDSVLKIHGETLVDLTFPPSINKKSGSIKISKTYMYGSKKYELTRFKNKTGAVRREKIIFKKKDENNFQFFYLNFPEYVFGIGYYAYGIDVDDTKNDRIPYVPYPLNAFTIFNDNNKRYVIVYDDQPEILPVMNNSVRIFLLDKNLTAQKVIFLNESNNNLLYNIKLNRVYSLKMSFSAIYSTDFTQLFDASEDLPTQYVDLKSLKGEPFFNWRLK